MNERRKHLWPCITARRMNGCDGAVCVSPVCAKQMKFPLNNENVNQEKDNRSVVLTVSLAGWFGLWKENRALKKRSASFSPPLLMRQLLHHSSETLLHQCISHRHTNHKSVKEVTAKHILPRLYNFFSVYVFMFPGKNKVKATQE